MSKRQGQGFFISKNRVLSGGVALCLIMGILFYMTGAIRQSSAQYLMNDKVQENAAKQVAVYKVDETGYPVYLNYRGVIQPEESKRFGFLYGGKLSKLYVAKGDLIRKGDVLAKIDTQTMEISQKTAVDNINSASNSLAQLKSNLDATEKLYSQGAVSEKDYTALKTQYLNGKIGIEVAKNSLKEIETTIKNGTIISDFDGYVMELPYKEGEIVGAGYPVVVAKGKNLKVAIGVSTEDFQKINQKSKVLINRAIEGQVKTMGAYPDETNLLYATDIVFKSDELALGETVDVDILIGSNQGCFIPLESLFTVDGIDYVYLVKQNAKGESHVSRVEVKKQELSDSQVRVTGLEANSEIVMSGIKDLSENDAVIAVHLKGVTTQ